MLGRLNLHIDETGSQGLSEGLCIVAVVLHEHSADIVAPVERYEEQLEIAGLPDVPFHGKDLLHGNEDYRTVSPGDRKRLLTQLPASCMNSRSRISRSFTAHRTFATGMSLRRGFGAAALIKFATAGCSTA
ncbi:MAG: hypothetical protein Q4C41_00810 [Eggerthellaceae bacterium]|nr:hypothetical protein [Eggerthellaceae bacterium]